MHIPRYSVCAAGRVNQGVAMEARFAAKKQVLNLNYIVKKLIPLYFLQIISNSYNFFINFFQIFVSVGRKAFSSRELAYEK